MNRNNKVNFDFNEEQLIKFKQIFQETKRVYPELLEDDVSILRIEALIAHCILTNDAPLNPIKKEDNQVILDLDEKI